MGEAGKEAAPAQPELAVTQDQAGFAATLGAAESRGSAPVTVGPHRIGRFVVLRELGRGGMGVVYAAYDEELSRKVAVKLLRKSDPSDQQGRARIQREAQAMARVAHPNVVSVYEVGELDGQVFIGMEFVEGTTLGEWQRQPGLSWETILLAYLAAGQGLLAAHQAGLVHRDFKPDNVLVGTDGRVRVADFGLARVDVGAGEGAVPIAVAAIEGGAPAAGLTVAGAILGTPGYMSPEQHRGLPADEKSDQFSFCVALYEALYGVLPFAGTTLDELSASVSAGAVRPIPASSPVPPPVAATLLRGLSLSPADRYRSMAELVDALSIDPRRDRSAAPGSRYLIFSAIAILMAVTFYLSQKTWDAHSLHTLRMYQVGLLQLGVVTSLAVLLRSRLRWHTFHWNLLRIIVLMLAQMALVRWLALRAGLELRWMVAIDLLAFASGQAAIALLALPVAWFNVVVCVGTIVALAESPLPLEFATQLVYPLATAIVAIFWLVSSRGGRARADKPRLPGTTSVHSSFPPSADARQT